MNKTANQLWTQHHAVTNDYYVRMLPISECECATLIRQIYSQRDRIFVKEDLSDDIAQMLDAEVTKRVEAGLADEEGDGGPDEVGFGVAWLHGRLLCVALEAA